MTNTPSMLTGHLAHDLLHTLADLDKGDKLLGIGSLLDTTAPTIATSVKHPIGLAAVVVVQWLFVYLIRHLMVRTAGTLMVETSTRGRRGQDTDKLSGHANLGYFRQALASPRRLRRDVVLSVTYNMIFLSSGSLLSSITSSFVWGLVSQVIVGLLLANLHLRWTCVTVSCKKPTRTRIILLPSRDLILPSMVHVLAQQVTARLPAYISRTISGLHSNNLGGIAVADATILITAFGLRLLALYPAFAARVSMEMRQLKPRETAESVSKDRTEGLGLKAYSETVKLCFRRTTLGFGLLHLQMVSVLVVFELIMTPILYKAVF